MTQALRSHDYDTRRVTARELRQWMAEIHELLDRLISEIVILGLSNNQMQERFADLEERLEEHLATKK
jgi:hypothetical protein